jgi:hypothetical protein
MSVVIAIIHALQIQLYIKQWCSLRETTNTPSSSNVTTRRTCSSASACPRLPRRRCCLPAFRLQLVHALLPCRSCGTLMLVLRQRRRRVRRSVLQQRLVRAHPAPELGRVAPPARGDLGLVQAALRPPAEPFLEFVPVQAWGPDGQGVRGAKMMVKSVGDRQIKP